MRPRAGIATKLIAAYLGALLPVALLFGLWAYTSARDALEAELARSLATSAALTAASLESSSAARIARMDADSEATRAKLTDALYATRRSGDFRRVLLVDTDLRVLADSGLAAPFSVAHDLQADRAMIGSTAGGHPQASVLFWDDEGVPYMRGYARVAHQGRTIAYLAVEGDAPFFARLDAMRMRIFAFGAALLAMIVAVTVWISRRLTAPLTTLAHAAGQIGGGDFHAPVPEGRDDEIGTLSTALRRMQRSLAAREEEARLMLAGIAHEIRNPLGGMEIYAGLLEEALRDGTPEASHAARVRRELDYLKQVVEDFLNFARDRPLRWVRRPMRELLESAVCEPSSASASVRVELDIVPEQMEVTGDLDALRGAVLNVVRNATEASPPGGRVTLRARELPDARIVEIEDRGPGMTPHQVTDALRPFFTTREQGTGLGLPLARKVVERHGGTLTLHSEPGRGTVVRMELPWRPGLPTSVPETSEPAEETAGAYPGLGSADGDELIG